MLTRRPSPSSCFRSRVGVATAAVVVTGATAVMVAVVVPGADRCAGLFSTGLVGMVVRWESQPAEVPARCWRREALCLTRPSQTPRRVVMGRAGSPAGEAAGELVL